MKAIVTGIAGFIGSNLAKRLFNERWQVVGIDNLSRAGSELNLRWLREQSPDMEFFNADIRSCQQMDEIFSRLPDTDVVIHAAAQVAVTTSVVDPRHDFETNALGTLNVLEAVRRYTPGAALVYASTNKVYGELGHVGVVEMPATYAYADCSNGIAESEPLDFHSPYGCSKGSADQYVRDYSRIYGLCTTVVRQSCIYGPRQFGVEDQGWVAWFSIAATLGLPVKIFGDGKQVRDILWVDDLIDLYLAIIGNPRAAAGKVFNAGGGPGNVLSLLDLIDLLEESGYRLRYSFEDWRPGDQKIFVADSRLARKDLGWLPQVTPREGVARLLAWVEASSDEISGFLGLPLAIGKATA
jgi:CDP-paratose 2-epimerase